MRNEKMILSISTAYKIKYFEENSLSAWIENFLVSENMTITSNSPEIISDKNKINNFLKQDIVYLWKKHMIVTLPTILSIFCGMIKVLYSQNQYEKKV